MRPQVRTIKCGCGNCQLRKNVADRCPQELSKEAIWLWRSDFSKEEPAEETSMVEIMEEIATEEAERNSVPEVV